MRVHIIGPGVVGLATGRGLARFGHGVVYTDKGQDHDVAADIHLVCTPEDAAPAVVESLPAYGVIVVRSSVPPGACDTMAFDKGREIWHWPEFLREATAESDFLEAALALIGYTSRRETEETRVKGLLESMGKRVVFVHARESELLKLVNNAYLATLISFWNDIKALCDNLGVNSHHMAALMMENDQRIQPYGARRHGAPYGGACLPKDTLTLANLVSQTGIRAPLLAAVRETNRGLGGY